MSKSLMKTKTLRSLSLAAAFALPVPAAISAEAPAPAARQPVLVDAIVAVVNSEVITLRDLKESLQVVELRMKAQNIQLPPKDQMQKQMLERMILVRAQMQQARDLGIRVEDALLDRAMARIAEQNKQSLQAFRDQIEREGIPYAHFREEVREEIVMQRLREREVDNKLQISESEVDGFVAASAAAASGGEMELNIAQILIRLPENATAQQIAQRRQRAEEAMAQLRSGASFAKVAAGYSDAAEALKGGELGWRSAARQPQLFLEAVAPLKPGEVSQIVRSANGFHILTLLGKRNASSANGGPAAPMVQQTHARHILVKVNQVVSAAEAKRKLLELKARLDNKAAKFEELARLYSNDGSASKGGDLGWIYPGDTVPEFERAMNALKPGEVSEPIESPFGYHLIEVLERKTEEVSRERQRMAARQALRERKIEEATEDWLRQLRDRAYVEYRLDEIEQR